MPPPFVKDPADGDDTGDLEDVAIDNTEDGWEEDDMDALDFAASEEGPAADVAPSKEPAVEVEKGAAENVGKAPVAAAAAAAEPPSEKVDEPPVVSVDDGKEAVSNVGQPTEERISNGETHDHEPSIEKGAMNTMTEGESLHEAAKDDRGSEMPSPTTLDPAETTQTGESLEGASEPSAPASPAEEEKEPVCDPASPVEEEKEPVEFPKDEPTASQAVVEASTATAEPLVSHEKYSLPDGPSQEKNDPAEAPVTEEASPNGPEQSPAKAPVVSDGLMENFSHQMQRVEENYQDERKLMEQEHARQIEEIRASLNHEACEAARRELEVRLLAQVEEKEEQIHEIYRVNEGYRLKLDVLKREVQGTQQLLEARDSDMGKANEDHGRYLKTLEQKVRVTEGRAAKANEEVRGLNAALELSKTALGALKEEHASLKARVKLIAGELKDRRVECRELGSRVVELTETEQRLQASVDNMQSQLSHQDRSRSDKDEEMEQLRVKLVDAATELNAAKKAVEAQEAKGEKALGEYKKKAQASLSLANSRTAAAVQAKEEAELDSRAARTTADSAMDRAVNAELTSKHALAEAKAHVKSMEMEKAEAVQNLELKKEELMKLEKEHAATQEQLQESLSAREKVSDELKEALAKLDEQQAKAVAVQEKLLDSEGRVKSLVGDVATLRESLQRAEAAATSTDKHDQQQIDAKTSTSVGETGGAARKSGDDETIRMLQQELHDANEAIEDLKEALKNAIQKKEVSRGDGALDESERSTDHATNGGNSTPLFFAMEKQAELNTARNEINRLANLLGSVQSDKTEAYEAMTEMKQRMEDAEARLRRFEKLGATSNGGSSHASSAGSTSIHASKELQHGSGEEARSNSSGSMNIEYLKNIMLRYLNAKTLAEKKALVPVIGAVLCLTADEQKKALQSVEESVSLGGVGASLFESFSGRITGN